ncbi:hypothetical protein JXB27_02565 [Candidatus Woesearchaeota archaeon]|nr:hypothetical protein [Candidatus Woesearchaeota archaeon]
MGLTKIEPSILEYSGNLEITIKELKISLAGLENSRIFYEFCTDERVKDIDIAVKYIGRFYDCKEDRFGGKDSRLPSLIKGEKASFVVHGTNQIAQETAKCIFDYFSGHITF